MAFRYCCSIVAKDWDNFPLMKLYKLIDLKWYYFPHRKQNILFIIVAYCAHSLVELIKWMNQRNEAEAEVGAGAHGKIFDIMKWLRSYGMPGTRAHMW